MEEIMEMVEKLSVHEKKQFISFLIETRENGDSQLPDYGDHPASA